MRTSINVLLVDDEPDLLAFFGRHLSHEPDLTVVGVTRSEAPAALGARRPDVVVVDGGHLGRSFVRQLKEDSPTLKVLTVNRLRSAGHGSASGSQIRPWAQTPEPARRVAAAIRSLLSGDGPPTITLGVPPTSELIMHFQPIHDLRAGGAVSGVEALMRWGNQGELVPPGSFLPLVEAEGRMTEYDRHAITCALGQLRSWAHRPDLATPRWVSVNLGGVNLRRPDLSGWIGAAIESAGVEPASLILEFDHADLVADVSTSARRLSELRSVGVRTAIDNVATAPSGLSGVTGLPLDVMKVSHKLTRELPSPAATEVLASLLQAATKRGWPCIAAGIERADQLEALRIGGWQFAQGHLLSRPMTASGCETLLAGIGTS